MSRQATPVARLLVDVRPVDHPTSRERGIGRYTVGLLRGLRATGAEVTGLYASDVQAREVRAAVPDVELLPMCPRTLRAVVHAEGDRGDGGPTWFVATQLMLPPIDLDPIPSIVTTSGLPVAAVMYDVIPYRHPERYLATARDAVQARLRAPLARTVDVMLAISEFSAVTAAEVLSFPLERIRVVGAGVEPWFVPAAVHAAPCPERVLPAGVAGYVVAVTGGDDRKNTEGLLRAWGLVSAGVRGSCRLVVATGVAPVVLERWRAVAVEVGVVDEVVFTGWVSDEELVGLLQGARLSVMPSLEEGFGLPVLEAAACGCVVICSGSSSLVEVLDDPVAWFDPGSPVSMAGAIEAALVDEGRRGVLAEVGRRAVERFSWERAAEATVVALGELGRRWPWVARPPNRRLALAGPFGGAGSGVGRYDVGVVEALRRSTDGPEVEVFADRSGTDRPESGGFAAGALGRLAKRWDYDDVVAVLGSSPFHTATVALACSTPCHLWLHEASLVGVHVGVGHLSGSERWAAAHVAGQVGDFERPLLSELGPGVLLDAPRLDELGVTLLEPTLAQARSVIVSSERAAGIVRGLRPDGPPILVLPHVHPPGAARADVPSGADLVAPGWLAANKAPLIAVEVLTRLPAGTRLSFVGPSDERTARDVLAAAAAGGVADRVQLTGWVDDTEYRERLAAARVGLGLRRGDRGEMSGVVADLLSTGVPTVTTLATIGSASPGVQVVALDVDEIVAAVRPLLDDDERWAAASADAVSRAAAWTFDDVAAGLLDWLAVVDDLEPGTVRRLPDDVLR